MEKKNGNESLFSNTENTRSGYRNVKNNPKPFDRSVRKEKNDGNSTNKWKRIWNWIGLKIMP